MVLVNPTFKISDARCHGYYLNLRQRGGRSQNLNNELVATRTHGHLPSGSCEIGSGRLPVEVNVQAPVCLTSSSSSS